MSLFTIADLHLSGGEGINKPMEVFGSRWTDYTAKLEKYWRAVINNDDDIVVSGDISWALKLEEAVPDLKFLDSLPGRKFILKGNHDFWWSTNAKMSALFKNNNINSINILHNTAYRLDDFIICGSRGWFVDRSRQNTVGDVDYDKIVNRETMRLRLSIQEGIKLRGESDMPIIVFLHFPPVWQDFVCPEIVDVLHEYGIKQCYFGHIHGNYTAPRCFNYEGIDMILTAADFLNFSAMPIFPEFD